MGPHQPTATTTARPAACAPLATGRRTASGASRMACQWQAVVDPACHWQTAHRTDHVGAIGPVQAAAGAAALLREQHDATGVSRCDDDPTGRGPGQGVDQRLDAAAIAWMLRAITWMPRAAASSGSISSPAFTTAARAPAPRRTSTVP
ncbi:hypothetical protein [Streptomyces sp. ML-6]|uniref:hypothetical protein n=1 Tax=Streptomyces sp. ML-6 TaxID=2982693 RepID=UPI0032DEF42C